MIKKLLGSLAITGLLFAAACAGASGQVSAVLGQEFVLGPGQTASFAGEDLEIKFTKVISDSRCPQGVVCIWAGEVSCLLEITSGGKTVEKVIVESGSSPAQTTFGSYALSFDVQPYPKAGQNIAYGDYRLHLTVSRGPSLSGGILATFDVLGESYSIFITNPQTIEDVFALQRGESQANIPSGRILRGAVSYNQPWSWHIDSEDIHMAELTMELCDGLPSHVENDLDYWVDTVGRFCPWQAKLTGITDYR